jgi:hypothetical protein
VSRNPAAKIISEVPSGLEEAAPMKTCPAMTFGLYELLADAPPCPAPEPPRTWALEPAESSLEEPLEPLVPAGFPEPAEVLLEEPPDPPEPPEPEPPEPAEADAGTAVVPSGAHCAGPALAQAGGNGAFCTTRFTPLGENVGLLQLFTLIVPDCAPGIRLIWLKPASTRLIGSGE